MDVQSTVTKMRRLARAYQARLNFYLINRGELPDFEGAAAGRGEDGRGIVVGAVSALRAKQPYDFTFDPHSELSVEKLKDWIDQFLSGKLKKVGHGCEAARLRCCGRAAHPPMHCFTPCSPPLRRRDHRSKSCQTAILCRSTTRRGPCTPTISQSGTKLWETLTLPCSRCEGQQTLSLSRWCRVSIACAVASARRRKQLEEALELDPRSPILHYNMGQAREMIGEMEGAIAEYKLSLDNDIRYMDGA